MSYTNAQLIFSKHPFLRFIYRTISSKISINSSFIIIRFFTRLFGLIMYSSLVIKKILFPLFFQIHLHFLKIEKKFKFSLAYINIRKYFFQKILFHIKISIIIQCIFTKSKRWSKHPLFTHFHLPFEFIFISKKWLHCFTSFACYFNIQLMN